MSQVKKDEKKDVKPEDPYKKLKEALERAK